MSVYRFLGDHYINGIYYPKGPALYSTADVGGTLPAGWVPSAMVDPQDQAALNAFFLAGPQFPTLIFAQFVNLNVPPPKTYWIDNHNGTFTLNTPLKFAFTIGISAIGGPDAIG